MYKMHTQTNIKKVAYNIIIIISFYVSFHDILPQLVFKNKYLCASGWLPL